MTKITTKWHYFFLCSIAYIGVLFAASELLLLEFSTYETVVISVIISVPIMASYGYHAAVRRKALLASVIHSRSKIVSLLSGYLFRVFVGVILAIWTSLYIVTAIVYQFEGIEEWYFWIAATVAVLLMYLCKLLFWNIIEKNIRPFACGSYISIWASLIVALLLTIFFSVATNYGNERPLYDSFGDAVEAQQTYYGTNPIVGLFIDLYRFVNGLSDFGWSVLRTSEVPNVIYFAVYFLNTYVIFLGFTSIIGIFLIRPTEMIDCIFFERSPRILYASGAFVVLCICIYYMFLGFAPTIEKFGDKYVLPNTITRFEDMEERYHAQLRDIDSASYEDIQSEIDASFDHIEENVDIFLDWYYSFRSTPIRYLSVLSRRLIKDKMEELLLEDDLHISLEAKLEMYEKVRSQLTDQFIAERDQMILERSINPPEGVRVKVLRSISESDIEERLGQMAMPGLPRLGLVSAGGFVAGAITSKILNNVITVVTKRFGQAAVRNGLKALVIGSASTPVTVTVAVIAAVGTELILLKIEEILKREQLKADIMSVTNETKRALLVEVKSLLVGTEPRS